MGGGGETFAPLKLDLLRAASSPVKKGQGARSSLPVPYAAALPDFFFVCVCVGAGASHGHLEKARRRVDSSDPASYLPARRGGRHFSPYYRGATWEPSLAARRPGWVGRLRSKRHSAP